MSNIDQARHCYVHPYALHHSAAPVYAHRPSAYELWQIVESIRHLQRFQLDTSQMLSALQRQLEHIQSNLTYLNQNRQPSNTYVHNDFDKFEIFLDSLNLSSLSGSMQIGLFNGSSPSPALPPTVTTTNVTAPAGVAIPHAPTAGTAAPGGAAPAPTPAGTAAPGAVQAPGAGGVAAPGAEQGPTTGELPSPGPTIGELIPPGLPVPTAQPGPTFTPPSPTGFQIPSGLPSIGGTSVQSGFIPISSGGIASSGLPSGVTNVPPGMTLPPGSVEIAPGLAILPPGTNPIPAGSTNRPDDPMDEFGEFDEFDMDS